MAAAWFNLLADPTKARAISAGTDPAPHVHPEVVSVMSEVGVDLSGAPTSTLTTALAQRVQLLVTMGCGDQCPVVPGLERDDWALEDPKSKPLARVRQIRDEIRQRVETLLQREGWRHVEGRSPMTSVPIACTLSPEALRARRDGLLADLVKRAERHERTAEGLRVSFCPGAETLSMLAQVVEAERQCCRFLRFVITVEPDGGAILLELSGPEGTRAFIEGLLDV
jgi:arsenate reductase